MTLTWQHKQTRSAGVFGRMLAFALAALVCTLLVYLALTQRFSAIADLFADISPITIVTEPPLPVEPPQETERENPPPALRETPATSDAPPAPTFDLIATTPSDPAPPAPLYINATFLERPNGRDFERLFPRRALERGMSGNVVLDCRVAANGRLSCAIAAEDPQGWGFGEASLRAAQQFRVAPATADGQATSGGRLRVPISWRISG